MRNCLKPRTMPDTNMDESVSLDKDSTTSRTLLELPCSFSERNYNVAAAGLTEIVDSFIKKASCVARNARESSSLEFARFSGLAAYGGGFRM